MTSALESLDCTKDVTVSLSKGEATLICTDPDHDHAKLVEAVESVGFQAEVKKQ